MTYFNASGPTFTNPSMINPASSLTDFFYAPLTYSLFPRRSVGSMVPNFTRATVATVTDHDGVVRQCKSGEARFYGARRVENLCVSDFSNAGWVNAPAGTGSSVTKSTNYTGVAAPDGTYTACRIQPNLNGGTTTSDRSMVEYTPTYPSGATTSVGSCWMRTTDGSTKTVYMRCGTGTASFTINGTWARYSTGTMTSGGTFSIGLRGGLTPTCSNSIDLLIWHPQAENVTGASVQTPGEFVPNGVTAPTGYYGANVTGVQYFNYANGNTVSSNVVTEAAGSAISSSTTLGFLCEPSRTNYLLNSLAPATQTTGSLSTGYYTISMVGSGSITVAAGTATITGGGSATAASPLTINVTVAGTVSCTVVGTVTTFQLEAGQFPTSLIVTTGATATRNADVLYYDMSQSTNYPQGSMYGEFYPLWRFSQTGSPTFHYLGDVGSNYLAFQANSSFNVQFVQVTGGASQGTNLSASTYASATSFKMAASWTTNNCIGSFNGASVTDTSVTLPSTSTIKLYPGSSYGGGGAGICTKNIYFWPTTQTSTSLNALTV